MNLNSVVYEYLIDLISNIDRTHMDKYKQLNLFLIWLKYYLPDELISIIGGINRKTWANIRERIMNILYSNLASKITLGTKKRKIEGFSKCMWVYGIASNRRVRERSKC